MSETYKQYKDARKAYVLGDQLSRTKLIENSDNVEEQKTNPISSNELVYLEKSPNYCNGTLPDGTILTTIGRNCTRQADDWNKLNCDLLCHKCGYKVKSVKVPTSVRCKCKYDVFSKKVNCEICLRNVTHNWCVP